MPRRHRTGRVAIVVVAALGLLVGGGIGVNLGRDSDGLATADRTIALAAEIGDVGRLQRRLADQPADSAAWAALGAAYLERSRANGDPSLYAKAEEAITRSLALDSTENLPAFIGMGALANARHDFAQALTWGQKARAVSDFSPGAYGVLVDAYTQLGRRAEASAAAQRMLDLSPTLPALSRAAYDLEQRGSLAAARQLLTDALEDSFEAASIGFLRHQLGELAINAGELGTADGHYRAGLAVDPGNPTLLHGRAKVAALRGKTADAVRDYAELVGRVPNPQYLVEYGEVLLKAGRTAEAAAQFEVVETVQRLFVANGGKDELSLAEYEADHGSPDRAVSLARKEWDRRQFAVVADALAWALHRAGDSKQALKYADLALAGGWRNALFAFHRSEIQRALGNSAAARSDAALAKRYNPAFDPDLPALGRSL
ncbi:MAG: tetratricopeptide repeat protein [Sporichthyaceae bacterium]